MRRFLKIVLIGVGALVGLVVVALSALLAGFYWNAGRSDWPRAGEIATRPRPASPPGAAAGSEAESGAGKQILFGDLHVHTSYSTDAMVQGLPLLGGEGVHPPADACDFARFCSALDFWSINDHAESLTASEWETTKAVVRACNDVAGDPDDPDLVSFLGWEWSQGGLTPETHFGHKNVVLLGTADDEIPARPIAANAAGNVVWGLLGLGMSLRDLDRWDEYADLHRATLDTFARETCAEEVDVRDLPPGCHEVAETPDVLFEKLDQWGHRALVIPHGMAWGITNPKANDLAMQLRGAMHDPDRQRLLEIYSGHGNSEIWADLPDAHVDEKMRLVCPEPTERFEPCCWRAGEIVRARCVEPESRECQYQVDEARKRGAGVGPLLPPTGAVLHSTIEDFGECGQLRGAFLPAFDYRPRGSAQYALATTRFDGEADRRSFRFGFLASSDNHRARGGSGYKEFGRTAMTDGASMGSDWRDRRAASFYYTGGLVAVHAPARDRESIFEALERREVYGTSGDRILLWFDLLGPDGERAPMGSEVASATDPAFEVRAVGAFEQTPGCPETVTERLTPERLQRLCLGECYNPGETRRAITRIEVVRIRPQVEPGERIGALIEDPWKVLPCPGDPSGCRVTFDDPDFVGARREIVYYVRAIQEPTPAVNGDPLECVRDDEGRCLEATVCPGGGAEGPPVDDCLADVEERAWSSPIFVSPAGE